MMLDYLLQQLVGGVVIGTAAFVNATGIDFDDEMLLADQFHTMVGEFCVPIFLFGKEAVLVVHFYFVEMSDNIKTLYFNHFVSLFPESSNRLTDVAGKEILKPVVVNFAFGAIDEPDIIAVGSAYKVHPPDDIIEVESFAIEGKGLGHARDEVAFQPTKQLYFRILLLESVNGIDILRNSLLADAEIVVEGHGGVRGEAELGVMKLNGLLDESVQGLLPVAESGVGMVIVLHGRSGQRPLRGLEGVTGGDVEEVIIEQHSGVVVTVGEKEEAGARIHLKGQRDVGKFILLTA